MPLKKYFKKIEKILKKVLHFRKACAIITKLSVSKRRKTVRCALLAQLDRASGYGPEGQEFESLTACQRTRQRELAGFLFFVQNPRGWAEYVVVGMVRVFGKAEETVISAGLDRKAGKESKAKNRRSFCCTFVEQCV